MIHFTLVSFFLVTLASVDATAAPRGPIFVITGSTGILGTSLCTQLASIGGFGEVYMGYRHSDRLIETLSTIKSVCSEEIVTRHFHPFRCDFPSSTRVDTREIQKTLSDLARRDTRNKGKGKIVIINNAGVCIKGSSKVALQESLDVNALHPIDFALDILNVPSIKSYDVTVVNISSGDGELAWLHSDLAKSIARLDTLADWYAFVSKERNHWRGEEFEYAYGNSPMYSLSKALLNAGTRALHNHVERPSSNMALSPSRKVISVCPGNFASPMSTEEEREGASSPEEAAAEVLRLAWVACQGGGQGPRSGCFYRHGKAIPW